MNLKNLFGKKKIEKKENLEEEYKKVWDDYCDIRYGHFHKMKVAQEITRALEGMLIPCPNGLVLDGGCGTGMLFRKILDKTQASQLIAGDFSDKMLNEAEKKINNEMKDISNKIKLINFDLGKKFPFPDEKFDAEIFNLSIHYLPHEAWKQSLKEVWRTTKHGGYIYITAQTRDFDFSKGYKKEVFKEMGKKLLSGQISFVIWLIKAKKIFVSKIDRWTKNNVIIYPTTQELVDYQKKLGFDKVEILGKPYYGTCIATRAHKP